ncbi:MAG: hypothetical protein KC645_19685 [Gemmatimonadetes bacterium]|nr:hypothetical protein [Gemmatimonadota bacterium]
MRGTRIVRLGILLIASGSSLAGCAAGRPWGFSPLAGIDVDAEELFVGADAWVPLEQSLGAGELFFVPGFDWYPFLGEDVGGINLDASLWGVNGDLVWAFGGDSFAPFVRGGLALRRSSSEVNNLGRETMTDFAFDFGAGGFLGGDPMGSRPFGQVGLLLGDGSSLYLSAGYRLQLGGTP